MGLGKTYSTSYLADSNNNTGVAGQVLISTATGINWSDGTDIIGGPYLPLAGGTLSGNLTMDDSDVVFKHTDGFNYYRVGVGTNANFEIYNTNYGRTDLLITQSTGDATFAGTINATGRVKVTGGDTDQYFYEGARTGVGVTLRMYDNANNIYLDGWAGIALRANQIGGSGGNITLSGGTGGATIIMPNLGSNLSDEVTGLMLQGVRHDIIFKQIRTVAATDWHNTTQRIQARVDTTLMQSIDFVTDASYNRHIDINTASNAFNSRFTHNGRLGIGTDSPSTTLSVKGTSSNGINVIGVGTTATRCFLGLNSANKGYLFIAGSSGENPAVITSQGDSYISTNLGIGTTGPGAKLEVKGNFKIERSTITEASELTMEAGEFDIKAHSAYKMRFFTGGSEKMRIDTSGSVGIGTTTNTTIPLHVNQTGSGTVIKAQGIGATIEIQSGTAGNATLYQRPNITGDKEAEFRCTLGSTYGWSWKDDNATATSRVKFMKLDQNPGTLTVKGDVVAYGSPSDKRLKENIKPIDSALDKVMKLQGVTFDWKQKEDVILDIKEDIGFIAQDVQKVVPELIRENSNGLLSMRHQGMAPILLEAIKELKAEIDLLKSKSCNCK